MSIRKIALDSAFCVRRSQRIQLKSCNFKGIRAFLMVVLNHKIKIAVIAIIKNHITNEVLLSKRQSHQSYAGYWEFPGGKLEENESPKEALVREMKEELSIDINKEELLPYNFEIWNYQDFGEILLLNFEVLNWSGEPKGAEGQEIKWVKIDDLHKYPMPEANVNIINQLQSKD